MSAALINLGTRALVAVLDGDGPYAVAAGGVSASGATVGWVSPDGTHALVAVVVVPPVSFDPVTQVLQQGAPVVGADVVTVTQTAMALPTEQAAANQRALSQAAFQALLDAGVAVTSTSNPALDATYPFNALARQNVQAVVIGILAAAVGIITGSGLPGGGTTFNLPDVNQDNHAFDKPTFVALTLLLEDYYYAVSQGQQPATPLRLP